MSYEEYLTTYCDGKDNRTNWIWWKVSFCNMSLKEATKSAYLNYKPLKEN